MNTTENSKKAGIHFKITNLRKLIQEGVEIKANGLSTLFQTQRNKQTFKQDQIVIREEAFCDTSQSICQKTKQRSNTKAVKEECQISYRGKNMRIIDLLLVN